MIEITCVCVREGSEREGGEREDENIRPMWVLWWAFLNLHRLNGIKTSTKEERGHFEVQMCHVCFFKVHCN